MAAERITKHEQYLIDKEKKNRAFKLGGRSIAIHDPNANNQSSGVTPNQLGLSDLQSRAKTQGYTDITIDGKNYVAITPGMANNPGVPTKNLKYDQSLGVYLVPQANWLAAHKPTATNPMIPFALAGGMLGAAVAPGVIAGAGAEASAGGELLSGMDLAADAAVGSGNYIGGGAAAGGLDAGAGASQLIDGSAQSIYDVAANAGIPGYDTSLTSGVAAGGAAGSALGGASTGFFDDILNNIGLPDIDEIPSKIKDFLPGGLDSVQKLFGGGGVLNTAAALAPSLAAINYAKNQDPFDTSRLESVYESINPGSVALPYDLETAGGRERLTSSLSDRGVMGSSFGEHSLSSYNTLRDVGRSNLITGAAGTQANVANQILQAQVKERELKNNLYGRALLALSGALGPGGGGSPSSRGNGIMDLFGGGTSGWDQDGAARQNALHKAEMEKLKAAGVDLSIGASLRRAAAL